MARPTFKLEAFPLELAIWENEKDGKKWHSCKLSKRYKDDDTGEWKSTTNLSARDLPLAANLLLRAHMEIGIQKET